MTLSDHLDVILARALPVVVDAVLSGKAPTAGPLEGLEDARKTARQAPLASRRELQRLQSLYDGGPEAGGTLVDDAGTAMQVSDISGGESDTMSVASSTTELETLVPR